MAVVVDADTHVAEPAAMWEHVDPQVYPRRPVVVRVPTDTAYGTRNAFWLIDNQIFPRPIGRGSFRLVTPSLSEHESGRTDIHIASRELMDVQPRLRDMDRLSVDVQVIYPTLFLVYLTDDPVLETAFSRAYNRYMAQACAASNGRLRWVVVPPKLDVDAAIAEVSFGKENGAVGVFFRGIEGNRTLDDPYFFPIYREAQRLNLPICIHTAAGCPAWTNVFDINRSTSFPFISLLPVVAFRDLVGNRIPEKFPDLRFGFIEAGASWVPYLLHVLKRSSKRFGERHDPALFRDYRIYVACEADEDLRYLLNRIPEDHLIIGSDYGHNDPAEERALVATMRAREDVPGAVIEKILGENARALYGI